MIEKAQPYLDLEDLLPVGGGSGINGKAIFKDPREGIVGGLMQILARSQGVAAADRSQKGRSSLTGPMHRLTGLILSLGHGGLHRGWQVGHGHVGGLFQVVGGGQVDVVHRIVQGDDVVDRDACFQVRSKSTLYQQTNEKF